MNVCIYTEYGSSWGFGHLSRCTALAEAFEDRGISPTIILAEENNHPSWHSGIGIHSCDIAIIDSYRASEAVRTLITHHANVTFSIEDDKHVFLRKAFRNISKKESKNSLETILITFGGSDPKNMTARTVDTIRSAFPLLKKYVVLGPGYQGTPITEDTLTAVVTSPSAEEFKEIMLKSDIAISAGGQTLYELTACGVALIAVVVADNQKPQVEQFINKGAAITGDVVEALKILHAPHLRASMIEAGYLLGKANEAEITVKHLIAQTMTLRTASDDDREILWQWRNDPLTRAMSKNRDTIPWEEHCRWYQNAGRIFIGMIGDDAIGTIRFDKTTVSLTIAPAFRNKGYGKTLLSKGCAQHDSDTITAHIRTENIASIRCFETCGFMKVDEKNGIAHYKL